MDSHGPFLNPGDQKVIGQAVADPSHETHVIPSSRTVNRVWMVLMLFLTAVGVWCAIAEELIAGIVMVVVGVVVTGILVWVEVSERMMVRRMSRRGVQNSDSRNAA